MRFVAKAQESLEQDVNMMIRGFVKIQNAEVLCLRLQCLERIRTDVLKFTTGIERQVNKMSDDLISRKAVIETVDRHTREDGTLDDDISVILKEVKTAFDKERVIDELIAGRFVYAGEDVIGESTSIRIDKAIKIVEKGGIE